MKGRSLGITLSMAAVASAAAATFVFVSLQRGGQPDACCAAKPSARAAAPAAAAPAAAAPAPAAEVPDYETSKSSEPPAGLATIPFPNAKEREFWRTVAKRLFLRPPCCGACSFLKQSDFTEIASVLKSDARPTAESIRIWNRYGPSLAASLRNQDPELFKKYEKMRTQN